MSPTAAADPSGMSKSMNPNPPVQELSGGPARRLATHPHGARRRSRFPPSRSRRKPRRFRGLTKMTPRHCSRHELGPAESSRGLRGSASISASHRAYWASLRPGQAEPHQAAEHQPLGHRQGPGAAASAWKLAVAVGQVAGREQVELGRVDDLDRPCSRTAARRRRGRSAPARRRPPRPAPGPWRSWPGGCCRRRWSITFDRPDCATPSRPVGRTSAESRSTSSRMSALFLRIDSAPSLGKSTTSNPS